MRNLAKIFKALGNQRRLKILQILGKPQVLSVGDIAQKLDLSVKSTSRHLLKLEEAGFVSRHQQSLNVFYSLPDLKKANLTSDLLRLIKKGF